MLNHVNRCFTLSPQQKTPAFSDFLFVGAQAIRRRIATALQSLQKTVEAGGVSWALCGLLDARLRPLQPHAVFVQGFGQKLFLSVNLACFSAEKVWISFDTVFYQEVEDQVLCPIPSFSVLGWF